MIVSMQMVGLSRRAIADDQLALAAADRNHRVDGHDPGLHRLADGPALDDPGRELLDRIGDAAVDRPLAVERLAERVDDAAEQPFADRHLEQLAGRRGPRRLPASLRVVAEDDDADLGLVEVQRQAGDAVAEVEHLVQHHVGQSPSTLATPSPISRMTPTLCLAAAAFGARDLGFDFLDQVSHSVISRSAERSQTGLERRQPGAHAAVVDIAADLDTHAADERGVLRERWPPGRAVERASGRPDARRAGRRAAAPRSRRRAVCRSRSSRTRRRKSDRIGKRAAAPGRRDPLARPAATRPRRARRRRGTGEQPCRAARCDFSVRARSSLALQPCLRPPAAWPSPRRDGDDPPASGSCR